MSRRTERLIVLALIGFVFLNYPVLSVFAVEGRIASLPVFYVYLFLAWGAVIAATWVIMRERGGRRGEGRGGGPREGAE